MKEYNNKFTENFIMPSKSLIDDKFITYTKRLIRTDDRYDEYLYWLREIYGLTFCQIHPHIDINNLNTKVKKGALVEMHHHPFTLEDICMIIGKYMLENNLELSTFTLANKVLLEHRLYNISTVMLCKNCHKLADAGKLFIPIDMTFGNIKNFIKKYGIYMNIQQKKLYNDYIKKNRTYKGVIDDDYLLLDTTV